MISGNDQQQVFKSNNKKKQKQRKKERGGERRERGKERNDFTTFIEIIEHRHRNVRVDTELINHTNCVIKKLQRFDSRRYHDCNRT